MTNDNTEEAPTAEVPVDAQSSSGPEHGTNKAEAGSSALQELLELSRQQRLQELREAPTGELKSGEDSPAGARSPKTTTAKAKPKAEQKGASQRIAQRVARRTVGRLVSGTSVNTQPVPIVTALKGSPYKAPVQASEPNEDEARMVLDLAADIAAIMMRAGAGTSDIEVSVIAACAAFGLTTAQVDLTSNTLTVHYSTSDGRLMTVMRVNRGESIHFAKLGSVHKLVTDLVAGNLGFNDARSRLDAIRYQRRPYQDWVVTGAWGLMVGSLVVLLGGGPIAAGLGIIMSTLISWVGRLIGRTALPSFFITALQAAIATLMAMVAGNFGIIQSPQFLVAAGIVLLLPTQSLYSSVQDALTNFPLTAAGRMVGVVLTLAGIVSGLALGVVTGEAIGLDPIEVLVPKTSVHVISAIVSMVAAAVVAVAGVIAMQSTRRFILPGAFVGLASYITMTALTIIAIDNVLASLLAATVTGFLARPLSLRLGAPAIVLMIPAIYTLLQGLSIFTAVYQIVAESATTTFAVGLSALFTAILANAALAVGAVLGSYLARPLKNLKADAVEKTAESARSNESTITLDTVEPRD
ncbi:threonine/serine ThrE exporter family protein [Brevibacterium zhoupengii]|uniref:threonine/serine ThrE exporter family protein n=1 Tax=Brevibacterium zhoupengii TaxID=2898795 RepID=UPI001E5B6D70|nr:threonine/serine exporter family protein [Brevibacterium zhoupengii]